MSTKFKILVMNYEGAGISIMSEELKSQLPRNCSLVVSSTSSEDEIQRLAADADIIVGSRVPKSLIESARKLKMIQTIGTGADGVDVDAAAERGVIVCSAVGLNAIPVAEHALSLILALAKNIAMYDKKIRGGVWMRIPSILLNNKTLGIVGLGSVGEEIAKRARAFNMRIVALKRHPSEKQRLKLGIDFLGNQDSLPRILKESDFVVLSLVLTPETRNMIGERELRMMKKSAYLVNVSRGGVIDEEALIKVLRERTIAGAGLDVFRVEPINPDNPLLKLENVVLTPHAAGGGGEEEMMKERAKFIIRNIERITKGMKPEKVVDPNLKYVIE